MRRLRWMIRDFRELGQKGAFIRYLSEKKQYLSRSIAKFIIFVLKKKKM